MAAGVSWAVTFCHVLPSRLKSTVNLPEPAALLAVAPTDSYVGHSFQFFSLGLGNWVRSRVRGYRGSVASIARWSVPVELG